MSIEAVLTKIQEIQEYRDTHKLLYYKPYDFQKNYHNAIGYKTELPATLKGLMAANQIGKSTCGGFETALHLTGLYPDWWEGVRFTKPINWVCGTSTNDTTRDILQKELLGDPKVEGDFGKGAIPKELIGSVVKKPGVPNAVDSVMVKHVLGWSTCNFRAYEQGPAKWMGHRYDGAWLDEEPPQEILSQVQRAGLAKQVFILLATFTPENGVTQFVDQLMNDLKPGQALIQASWDDAPHMTPEMREANLAKFPAHERDMRSKGIPLMGSGLVFPVSEDTLRVDPFNIPRHWARIAGIDFGWDHPFGCVWVAHDRDTDTVYVYDCYKESKVVPPVHASAIKKRGQWIPIVWPHDGYVHDKGSGVPLAQSYRREGLNLLKEKFSNPPGPGAKEGSGGNGIEVGISHMLTMMEEGRFKVFSNLNLWWEEFRMYHRKDGKIVALKDDLMSSTRYAVQSLRFAHTEPVKRIRADVHQGITNWQ
jgi:phage terminase large subunit-like protein